jgi:hypothetical protein
MRRQSLFSSIISLKGQWCSFVTWAAFYMLTRMRASDCLSLFLRYLLLIGLSDCIGVPLVVQSYRSLLCCISSRKGCFCATLDYRRVPLSQVQGYMRRTSLPCLLKPFLYVLESTMDRDFQFSSTYPLWPTIGSL